MKMTTTAVPYGLMGPSPYEGVFCGRCGSRCGPNPKLHWNHGQLIEIECRACYWDERNEPLILSAEFDERGAERRQMGITY